MQTLQTLTLRCPARCQVSPQIYFKFEYFDKSTKYQLFTRWVQLYEKAGSRARFEPGPHRREAVTSPLLPRPNLFKPVIVPGRTAKVNLKQKRISVLSLPSDT